MADPKREAAFVEELGLFFENWGLPRMSGRIFGLLLIAEKSEQTSAEIMDALHTSKASVSTATRMLLQTRMIERVGVRGQRSSLFRVRSLLAVDLFEAKMKSVSLFREVLGRGLDVLAEDTPERALRLREIHDFYTWIEAEVPLLVERFRHRGKDQDDG